MQVKQVISSCEILIDKTIGFSTLEIYFVFLLVFLPMIRVVLSVIKTRQKINLLQQNCSNKFPAKLQRLMNLHGISNNKVLMSCNNEFIAITTGLLNKKIIFSCFLVKKLTTKELESVLLHELHHLKHSHSTILLFGEIITHTFFFLPILQDIFLNIKIELERSADCAAVDYQKTTKFIKQSLLKVLSYDRSFAICPQFAYRILDQRLDNLDFKKKKYFFSKKKARVSFFVLASFFVLTYFNFKYPIASAIEENPNCNLLECVQNCVSLELPSATNLMTSTNFSTE